MSVKLSVKSSVKYIYKFCIQSKYFLVGSGGGGGGDGGGMMSQFIDDSHQILIVTMELIVSLSQFLLLHPSDKLSLCLLLRSVANGGDSKSSSLSEQIVLELLIAIFLAATKQALTMKI